MVADGESGANTNNDNDANISPSSLLRVEVVPLSKSFEMILDVTHTDNQDEETAVNATNKRTHDRRRVRIIHPYPYTFATFAKARWLGRTVADVYHQEFGEWRIILDYFIIVHWF